MTIHIPTVIKNRGGPPAPTAKPPSVPATVLIRKVGPGLLMLLVLAASVWLAFTQFIPPAVVPASASAAEFSAERAMTHWRVIAQVPHPMGSQANAAVRAYLIQQITAMGLAPEVQTTTVVQHFPGSDEFMAGTVHNVVVRLKGLLWLYSCDVRALHSILEESA